MGDGYLGRLLLVGATAVPRRISHAETQMAEWVRCLLKNKPARLVSVALANKNRPDRLGRHIDEGGPQASLRFQGVRQCSIRVARAFPVTMIFAAAAGTPRGIAWASLSGKLIGTRTSDFIRAIGQMCHAERAGQMTATQNDHKLEENSCKTVAVHS